MALLPPGVAQGILNAQQQQMADAKNKQAMEYQAWQIEQAKQAQARQTQAQQNYGGVLNAAYGGMAPPPVAGSQGPQPPAPGQASVPMAPPVSPNGGMIDTSPTEGGLYYRDYPNQYGLRAFKKPDGTYGGEMLPKSTGWLGLQQGEGKEHGNIMSEYSIDDAKGSFPTFVPTLDKNEIELLRQGKLTPSIIKKATAWRDSQEAKGESAFLNPKGFDKGGMGGMPTRAPMAPSGGMGGLPPYQTVQSLAQGQPPQAGGMDLMQPPPMPATNDIGTKPLTVASVVQLLKAQGVPQEQWYDTMSEMKPLFDEQNKQELLQLKTQMDATKMANDVYKAVLSGQNIESLIASRAKAAEGKWVKTNVQRGDRIVPVLVNSVTGEERGIPGETGGSKWNPNTSSTGIPSSPEESESAAAQATTGMPINQIIPGYGKNAAAAREKARVGAIKQIMAENPGMSATDAGIELSNRAIDFASNKKAAGMVAIKSAGIELSAEKIKEDIKTMDSVLDKASAKYGAKIFNTPVNAIRRQFSDVDLGQLDLATKQVALEYEKAMQGGQMSVAQLHAGAAEDAQKLLNSDMTPNEIRAKLPIMIRELDNAKKAVGVVKKDLRVGGSTGGADPLGIRN